MCGIPDGKRIGERERMPPRRPGLQRRNHPAVSFAGFILVCTGLSAGHEYPSGETRLSMGKNGDMPARMSSMRYGSPCMGIVSTSSTPAPVEPVEAGIKAEVNRIPFAPLPLIPSFQWGSFRQAQRPAPGEPAETGTESRSEPHWSYMDYTQPGGRQSSHLAEFVFGAGASESPAAVESSADISPGLHQTRYQALISLFPLLQSLPSATPGIRPSLSIRPPRP